MGSREACSPRTARATMTRHKRHTHGIFIAADVKTHATVMAPIYLETIPQPEIQPKIQSVRPTFQPDVSQRG